MTLDVPLSVKMDEWRRLAAERPLSIEECREIIAALRSGRATASAVSAKSRAAKAPVDISGLEDEIANL